MPRNGNIATRLPKERILADQISEIASLGVRTTTDDKFSATAIALVGSQLFWLGRKNSKADDDVCFKPLGRAPGTTGSKEELEELRIKAQSLLGAICNATGAPGATCSLTGGESAQAKVGLCVSNPLKEKGMYFLLPEGKPIAQARSLKGIARKVEELCKGRPDMKSFQHYIFQQIEEMSAA